MKNQASYGFTLIELVVVMGIITLLFGIGVTKYTNYSRQQILTQETNNLKNNLRLVQGQALSGEKDCIGALEGYEVTFAASSYRFRSRCSGTDYGSYATFNLPVPVQITSFPNSLFFKILAQGVLINGPSQIVLSGYGRTETIYVTVTGEIR